MPRIFVSFRKADERVVRDHVYRALVAAFGAEGVFKSGGSIPPGADYIHALTRQAAECEVMLVLIGPRWLDASDEHGRRLLLRDHDWVRTEIATAFAAGNRVVPVLLGDGTMLPAEADLPPDIAGLTRLQFLRVGDSDLQNGLRHLTAALAMLLPGLRAPLAQDAAAPRAAAPEPNANGQTAKASGGGVALNVGGNLQAKGARIIGGNHQGD